MARRVSRTRDLLQRLIFVLGLIAVVGALLSPLVLARGGRRQVTRAPQAALISQRSDSWVAAPPCPLSRLPEHRACLPAP